MNSANTQAHAVGERPTATATTATAATTTAAAEVPHKKRSQDRESSEATDITTAATTSEMFSEQKQAASQQRWTGQNDDRQRNGRSSNNKRTHQRTTKPCMHTSLHVSYSSNMYTTLSTMFMSNSRSWFLTTWYITSSTHRIRKNTRRQCLHRKTSYPTPTSRSSDRSRQYSPSCCSEPVHRIWRTRFERAIAVIVIAARFAVSSAS